MEVSGKRKRESIDGVPHVTNNPFLAEKQDVERVAKIQEADSKEGKPHGTTNPSLAEKQELETAKKPPSENKNQVAMSVESPKASKNTYDSDDDGDYVEVDPWPIIVLPEEMWARSEDVWDSDYEDETFNRWKAEYEKRHKAEYEERNSDSDCDSDDETHEEENKD